MNFNPANSYRKHPAPLKPAGSYEVRVMVCSLVLLISLIFCSCSFINQLIPSTPAKAPAGAGSTTDNKSALPATPATPVVNTPAAPASQTPAAPVVTTPPAPAAPPAQIPVTPPASPVSTGTTIKKEACLMALTSADMGEGWIRGSVGGSPILYTSSTCFVYYQRGGAFDSSVQNSVAVFRTVEVAINAYDKEIPANVSLSNPGIGDESFLNNSVPINRWLVFRKSNVVVWVWLRQYQSGDIEKYARIIEQRITP